MIKHENEEENSIGEPNNVDLEVATCDVQTSREARMCVVEMTR